MTVLAQMLLMAMATYPQTMPTAYSASLSVIRSGLTYSGSLQYDGEGRRWMEHISGLEQTTIVVQPDQRTITFTYVVIPTKPDPTCTCRTQLQADLSDPWSIYMNGVSNGTSCTGAQSGKTGTLYTVDMTPYVSSAVYQLCQASDGTPIFTTQNQEFREYLTFTPGRPDSFNTTALQGFLPSCSSGCSAPP